MMTYETASDDLQFEAAPAPEVDRTALSIRRSIASVESSLTEFDKIVAGLAALHEKYPADLVYDVTTTRGMQEAIAHRAAWRDPRIAVEKFRKTAKQPVLTLGKDIDARAAWITEQLRAGEAPADDQIKAEERRKDELRQAKVNAETGRVIAIQEAIGEITMAPMVASGKSSGDIAAALASIRAMTIHAVVFQEQIGQAKAAQDAAIAKLELMHRAKLHEETEAAKVAAERAELDELRKAVAAQRIKDEAIAAAAAATERERIAAEQSRLNAQATAARQVADRIATEQRAAAQAAHEAAMKAEREAAAEQKRIADDKAAKALAKQRKAEASEKMLRDAAGFMLAALRRLRPLMTDEQATRIIDAAILAATGEMVPA